jgi:hypothetical protein
MPGTTAILYNKRACPAKIQEQKKKKINNSSNILGGTFLTEFFMIKTSSA